MGRPIRWVPGANSSRPLEEIRRSRWMDVPRNWIHLDNVVAPRNWERTCGYTGDARFLSISWEQAG